MLLAGVLFALLPGCVLRSHWCDRECVSEDLQHRTGQGIGPPHSPCEPTLPPGVSFEDGLSEDEAIITALWNNAAFQEVLIDLDLTHADLIEAGLLPNPQLSLLFPVWNKQLEYTIQIPVEVLWLRPLRMASARFENERTCERLVQRGLDLIRDVRQAYADFLQAQERLKVSEESFRLRRQIAELAEARLRAGDINPLEAATARIDALAAEQEVVRLRHDVRLAEERLRILLGVGPLFPGPIVLDAYPVVASGDFDLGALTAEAVEIRPDAQAATHAVRAARERLRLARLSWFRIFGIVDANGGRGQTNIGPGVGLTVPVFNWGQGGKARAAAELEQADRRRRTVHDQIILDVRQAFTQYEQAHQELEYLDGKVRPEVELAITRADKAYREGAAPYFLVLETTRRLIDAQTRAVELRAQLRRALAELERSVGRRLDSPATPNVDAPPPKPHAD
jgi:cobalt-zinc-cadmium efflux system outer membrane protein